MIRSLTAPLALVLAIGCAAPPPAPDSASGPAFGEIPIIDAHTHILMQIPELPDLLRKNKIQAINLCGGAAHPETLKESRALFLACIRNTARSSRSPPPST